MATHTVDWQEKPPDTCRNGVVTIGNFDGVHRGHGALLTQTRMQARSCQGPAVVVTFDPHPHELLRPGQAPPLLTIPEERAQSLHELGADEVVILRTTAPFLALSAADFFHQVLCERFQVMALVEGCNFGFGRKREGNIEMLRRLCREAAVPLTVVPPQLVEGREISSSRIRAALLAGEVHDAAEQLGRPYRLHGVVGTGQQRGQKLGFPTANLVECHTLIPGDGVYAVRVPLDGRVWPAAANVGPNPTFGEQVRKVEVHLIGFQGNLYGHPLAVDFVERLRDTRPFADVNELLAQLRRDVEQARQLAACG